MFSSLSAREKGQGSPTTLRKTILGSTFFVESFKEPIVLSGHRGCVNSILFSDCGSYALTGSDDCKIHKYDVVSGKLIQRLSTPHTNNIFFVKDLPGTFCSELISCAADGRVIHSKFSEGSSKPVSRVLYRHRGRAHRIGMVPGSASQFFSCGEDGVCNLFDLRQAHGTNTKRENGDKEEEEDDDDGHQSVTLSTKLMSATGRQQSIYCIGVNPNRPNEIALGGITSKVSLFDTRKFTTPFATMCPTHLVTSRHHVTGIRYDYTGENVLASYNDDDVYLMSVERHSNVVQPIKPAFESTASSSSSSSSSSSATAATTAEADADQDEDDDEDATEYRPSLQKSTPRTAEQVDAIVQGYSVRYVGHRNSDTVKQVAFFGTRSEMVVSGSDCGHIFLWSTATGNLVKVLKGDNRGAVNCLAAHPHLPILGSSGLSHMAKLWAPSGDREPLTEGSEAYLSAQSVMAKNQRTRNTGESVNSSLDGRRRILRMMLASLQDEVSDDEDDEAMDMTAAGGGGAGSRGASAAGGGGGGRAAGGGSGRTAASSSSAASSSPVVDGHQASSSQALRALLMRLVGFSEDEEPDEEEEAQALMDEMEMSLEGDSDEEEDDDEDDDDDDEDEDDDDDDDDEEEEEEEEDGDVGDDSGADDDAAGDRENEEAVAEEDDDEEDKEAVLSLEEQRKKQRMGT